ncbi:MAG: SH3 domain-containing protein [Pirellulaceae bacterium]
MRGVTAILLCCSAFGTIVHGAEPTFPWQAQVSVDEVEVRCGPGWDYYATQRLPRGTRVEVYRHDPGGWLAIRPPEGSFSWMTARHLEMTSERSVAKVTLDGAVAWVGSTNTGVAQYKWQVRLDRGEQVEVLGEQAMSVGPGFATETYFKIAPPAGEFRWIHAEQAVSPHSAANQTVSQTASQPEIRSVGGPSANENREDSPGATSLQNASPELAKKVAELNVELALLVAQPIEQWDLESLQNRADALALQVSNTSLARELKAVSQRMAEYQTLQRRYQKAQEPVAAEENEDISKHGVSAAPQALPDEGEQDVHAEVGAAVTQTSANSGTSRYDTEGWLMPVHSTKRVAPPFAVLDDEGRVRAYVTPAPGLNLRRYAKKYVGLIGEQRYVSTLHAPHITAERVVKQNREKPEGSP